MTQILHVSMHGVPVGRISFDARDDRHDFQYTASWKQKRDAFYLSPAIALDKPVISGSVKMTLAAQMNLRGRLNLPVAAVEIRRVLEPVQLIGRFDRSAYVHRTG